MLNNITAAGTIRNEGQRHHPSRHTYSSMHDDHSAALCCEAFERTGKYSDRNKAPWPFKGSRACADTSGLFLAVSGGSTLFWIGNVHEAVKAVTLIMFITLSKQAAHATTIKQRDLASGRAAGRSSESPLKQIKAA